MRIRLIFAWYDFFMGLFLDRKKKRLYILYLPMCGIVIHYGLPKVLGKCQGNAGLCGKPATHRYSDLNVCEGHYHMYHAEFDEEYR